jgi:hypothetical protein
LLCVLVPSLGAGGHLARQGAKCSQSEARRTSFRHMITYLKKLPNSFYLPKYISFYLWLLIMTLAVDNRWMTDDSNHSSRVQGKQERGKRQCFMTISALFHHPPVCYSSNNIKLSKIQQKNAKLL